MEDDPFDFATSPLQNHSKMKKVGIGMDDLLLDHYKEKNKVLERILKLVETKKQYANSDDEEDATVARLSKCLDECYKKKVNSLIELTAEDREETKNEDNMEDDEDVNVTEVEERKETTKETHVEDDDGASKAGPMRSSRERRKKMTYNPDGKNTKT